MSDVRASACLRPINLLGLKPLAAVNSGGFCRPCRLKGLAASVCVSQTHVGLCDGLSKAVSCWS